MDHLTNVYKHKCEQLQEQLNNLQRMLNEAPPPGVIRRIPDADGGGNGGRPIRPIPNGPGPNSRPYGQNNPTIDPLEIARREAAAAAAHAAAVRAAMANMMSRIKTTSPAMWNQFFELLYSPIEREAFIAIFGSATPEIRTQMINGIEHSYVIYTTPNGQQAIWYTPGVQLPGGGWSDHPNWNTLLKGETPFGTINSQGFLVIPEVQLNNAPGDIFVRPNPTSTTPGGKITGPGSGGGGGGGGSGLGNQSSGPG